jgi:hypothetical protein
MADHSYRQFVVCASVRMIRIVHLEGRTSLADLRMPSKFTRTLHHAVNMRYIIASPRRCQVQLPHQS